MSNKQLKKRTNLDCRVQGVGNRRIFKKYFNSVLNAGDSICDRIKRPCLLILILCMAITCICNASPEDDFQYGIISNLSTEDENFNNHDEDWTKGTEEVEIQATIDYSNWRKYSKNIIKTEDLEIFDTGVDTYWKLLPTIVGNSGAGRMTNQSRFFMRKHLDDTIYLSPEIISAAINRGDLQSKLPTNGVLRPGESLFSNNGMYEFNFDKHTGQINIYIRDTAFISCKAQAFWEMPLNPANAVYGSINDWSSYYQLQMYGATLQFMPTFISEDSLKNPKDSKVRYFPWFTTAEDGACGSAELVMQDDGNVVIYGDGKALTAWFDKEYPYNMSFKGTKRTGIFSDHMWKTMDIEYGGRAYYADSPMRICQQKITIATNVGNLNRWFHFVSSEQGDMPDWLWNNMETIEILTNAATVIGTVATFGGYMAALKCVQASAKIISAINTVQKIDSGIKTAQGYVDKTKYLVEKAQKISTAKLPKKGVSKSANYALQNKLSKENDTSKDGSTWYTDVYELNRMAQGGLIPIDEIPETGKNSVSKSSDSPDITPDKYMQKQLNIDNALSPSELLGLGQWGAPYNKHLSWDKLTISQKCLAIGRVNLANQLQKNLNLTELYDCWMEAMRFEDKLGLSRWQEQAKVILKQLPKLNSNDIDVVVAQIQIFFQTTDEYFQRGWSVRGMLRDYYGCDYQAPNSDGLPGTNALSGLLRAIVNPSINPCTGKKPDSHIYWYDRFGVLCYGNYKDNTFRIRSEGQAGESSGGSL